MATTEDYIMANELLKQRIKLHEGFRDTVYLDSLGKRTVGFGHLCVEDFWEDGKKYDRDFLDEIFEKDFNKAFQQATTLLLNIKPQAFEIVVEMVYQLGIGNVSKFSKMIEALQNGLYEQASKEMLNSRWHKQTKSRCEALAEKMSKV